MTAVTWALLTVCTAAEAPAPMEFIKASADGWNFEGAESGRRFIPFGVNMVFSYDKDPQDPHKQGLRILATDQWDPETVGRVVKAVRALNMNILKVFLPSHLVLPDPQPDKGAAIAPMTPTLLERLDYLFNAARANRVYIVLTFSEWGSHALKWWQDGGTFLGRPPNADGPDTFEVFRGFWRTLANRYKNEPALFAYNFAVEFYMPGGNWGAGQGGDRDYLLNERWGGPAWRGWLAERYGKATRANEVWGTSYPTFQDVPQPEMVWDNGRYTMPRAMIADYNRFKEWVTRRFLKNQADAIREIDQRHMITCGFHPHQLALGWPGSARYNAGAIIRDLDFLDYVTTHSYTQPPDRKAGQGEPVRARRSAVLDARFAYGGRPVLIEEMGHHVDDPEETQVQTLNLLDALIGHASGFMLWSLTDVPDAGMYGPLTPNLELAPMGKAWRTLNAPGGLVAELPREREPGKTVIRLEKEDCLAPGEQTEYLQVMDNWDRIEHPVDFLW